MSAGSTMCSKFEYASVSADSLRRISSSKAWFSKAFFCMLDFLFFSDVSIF